MPIRYRDHRVQLIVARGSDLLGGAHMAETVDPGDEEVESARVRDARAREGPIRVAGEPDLAAAVHGDCGRGVVGREFAVDAARRFVAELRNEIELPAHVELAAIEGCDERVAS